MSTVDCLPLRPGLETYAPIGNGDPAFYYPAVPGILFRTINLEYYNDELLQTKPESAGPLAFISQVQKLHAELPFFGIEVVSYTPVITKNPKILMLAVHEVQGNEKREDNYYKAPKKEQCATDNLYDSLWDYLGHKIVTGESYLGDIIGLHQYLYTPEDSFVLVDIEPHVIPENNTGLASFNSDIVGIEHLVADVRSMYRYDKRRIIPYATKAAQLIATSAAMNGIDAPKSAIRQALNTKKDPDDISGHLQELLKDLPKNKDRYQRLEEKRQQAVKEITDQQIANEQ